jgi:RNA recognition motif-containing protein
MWYHCPKLEAQTQRFAFLKNDDFSKNHPSYPHVVSPDYQVNRIQPFIYPQHRTPLLKKLFVGNLPSDATEASVLALFSQFGKVRSIELVTDLFNGRCKGFGFIGMEGHEARAAIAKLDGFMYGEKPLKVNFEDSSGKKGKRR